MKLNKIFTVILTISFTTVLLANFSFFWNYKFYETDFLVFYSASKQLIHNPKSLYDAKEQSNVQNALIFESKTYMDRVYGPFVNLPLTLIFFTIVANLSTQTAFHVVGIIYYILTALIIILFRNLFIKQATGSHKPLSLLEFLFCITFIPNFIMVVATQTTLFYLYFLYISLFYLLNNKSFISGFWSSFLWINPQLGAITSLWFLIKDDLLVKKGAVVGLVTFLSANLAMMRGDVSFFKRYLDQARRDF